MNPAGAGAEESRFLDGTVLRRSSSAVWVDVGGEVLTCTLRGKLRGGEPCVVGDRVRLERTGPGEGAVERVLPRRSELCRGPLTGERDGRITAANIDQVAVVISAHDPGPRWALVDRLLVEAEREDLRSVVVLNKMDLVPPGAPARAGIDEAVEDYRRVGVEVLPVSAVERESLETLAGRLRGAVTVLSGHSGVGKTSLLNALVPGLDFGVREVNPFTGKGRHTTTFMVLVRLPGGGHAMDTPGFREFALEGISPPELGRLYPEFREVIGACRFKDCLHRDDPGCALKEAVQAGKIPKLRYHNYLQILRSLLEGADRSPRRSARRGAPDPS